MKPYYNPHDKDSDYYKKEQKKLSQFQREARGYPRGKKYTSSIKRKPWATNQALLASLIFL